MKKKCNDCKNKKDYSEFHKNKTNKDGYQRICKECKRKREQEIYSRDKQKHLDKNKKRRDEWRTFINSFKIKCTKCPETCTPCLDFHHLGDKAFSMTSISKQCFNEYHKERCKKEIEKCVVLCANCHRKLHNGFLKL